LQPTQPPQPKTAGVSERPNARLATTAENAGIRGLSEAIAERHQKRAEPAAARCMQDTNQASAPRQAALQYLDIR
jgi:hypothetical protein